MTTLYTIDDVAEMIRALARKTGSVNNAATAMFVTPSYLSQVLHGHVPGPAILEYFGLRKVYGLKEKYEMIPIEGDKL